MGTDYDVDRGLRTMLRDVPPHDGSARRRAMEVFPTTPQRHTRWLPPFVSDHLGRRPWMYAVAVTAACVVAVAAMGSASWLGRPSTNPGSAPAIAPGVTSPAPTGDTGDTGEEIDVPSRFSGVLRCGPATSEGATTSGGTIIDREGAEQLIKDREVRGLLIGAISDPRLDGSLVQYIDSHRYGDGPDAAVISAVTWVLEAEAGAWAGSFTSFSDDSADGSGISFVMDGSGEYDGLRAVMTADYWPGGDDQDCTWGVTGYVVGTEQLPDTPTPVS